MAADTLTGSRIRERRLINGLRQAELANKIGISASYLNLIEHNRRRIGGKLLNALAEALDVELSVLTEGAEASLLAALRDAEASARSSTAELDRIDDFTGRFPGWARLLSDLHRRGMQLEQLVENLNDRLTHDPKLASSVHEVLSTAASIRSTASILAENKTLEREWLDRFHANIDEDSQRLADSSRALAGYLEGDRERVEDDARSPQEEVDALFASHGYAFKDLEPERGQTVSAFLKTLTLSEDARGLAEIALRLYAADASKLPMTRLRAFLRDADPAVEPLDIATALDMPVGLTLRRLACLPELDTGYVLCDRAGSLIWRKPMTSFAFPRFGPACPLWPVFAAFSQPGQVLRLPVVQVGRRQAPLVAYATTEDVTNPGYNSAPLSYGGMLLRPATTQETPSELGSSCRLCPRDACAGRREPSVLV